MVKLSVEINPPKSAVSRVQCAHVGSEKFVKRLAENPFEFVTVSVVDPGLIVARLIMEIPKLLIGELNVKVARPGEVTKTDSPPCPSLVVQKAELVHVYKRSGYLADVAVVEIGELKS